jgi:hypothetical protein
MCRSTGRQTAEVGVAIFLADDAFEPQKLRQTAFWRRKEPRVEGAQRIRPPDRGVPLYETGDV